MSGQAKKPTRTFSMIDEGGNNGQNAAFHRTIFEIKISRWSMRAI